MAVSCYISTRNYVLQASATGRSQVWKKQWKLQVPEKIKIFGWRALHGLIPGREMLANRRIGSMGGCPLCLNGAEDIKHIIFLCARAKEVRRALGIWETIASLLVEDRSGSVILEEVIRRGEQIQSMDVGLTKLIMTGGWYIWWERRQHTHGEIIQRPSRSALSIAALTRNYKLSTKKEAKERKGWQKPPEGKIIVNVDASFDDDVGCGSRVVIRDHIGGVIAASHCFVPRVIDAPMAEAYALKEGLLLAQHIGSNRLIIESDCMEVVDTMKGGGFSVKSAAAIYDECNIIWSGFQEIYIEHCSRDENHVAHELAGRGMQTKADCIWDDEPPSFILQFVLNDVTVLQ